MFTIGICEDDREFVNEIRAKIERKFFQYNINCKINCFYSGEEILDDIISAKTKYDIIFLDIELPGKNGIEVARKIRELDHDTIFIFITYLSEKVYEVLNLEIFNFIRKSHFHKEIDSMLDLLIKKLDYLTRKYSFPIGDTIIYLKIYDILYIEVVDRNVIIHTIETNYTSNYRYLKEIPYNLAEIQFFEIFRGVLVNLNHVKNFVDTELILSNGTNLQISRRRFTGFKQAFYELFSAERGG